MGEKLIVFKIKKNIFKNKIVYKNVIDKILEKKNYIYLIVKFNIIRKNSY